MISAFFGAISNQKNICLKLNNNESEWQTFTPKQVKVDGQDINFVVSQNGNIEQQTIPFNSIAEIKMEEEFASMK